jgi:hypothetical protein
MLRDGRFVKELPPKIGVHYVPKATTTNPSKEEQFVQNILLGIREQRQSFLSKVFGLLLKV